MSTTSSASATAAAGGNKVSASATVVPHLVFDNVNLEHLPVDPEKENYVRTVRAVFSVVNPTPVENPVVIAARYRNDTTSSYSYASPPPTSVMGTGDGGIDLGGAGARLAPPNPFQMAFGQHHWSEKRESEEPWLMKWEELRFEGLGRGGGGHGNG